MNQDRKRVIMVLESIFPPTRGGGAESQVETLGQHLKRRGIDPLIVVPMVKQGPRSPRDVVHGLDIIRIPYPNIRKVGGLIMLARLGWLLVRHRSEYTAIHAHIANHMAAICCLVGMVMRKPVIVKLTGRHEMELGILASHRHGVVTAILRWALRKATYIQAISARLQSLLLKYDFNETRIYRIPNAVDTYRFRIRSDRSTVRYELALTDMLVGVFVGRLVHEKGLVPFLQSWFKVFPQEYNAMFLIVGTGELLGFLNRMIEEAGRSRQVLLIGVQSDVEHYLSVADFGVLPSLQEGLSNALLEFMAAGLPVLGSRVSGTEDLITPGETGWLFEAGNQSEIEKCLMEIMLVPRERLRQMGCRARQCVGQYAGIDRVAERLAHLYGLELIPSLKS